jgi:hypothetical protein
VIVRPRSLSEGHERRRIGTRGFASLSVLVLVASCTDSSGVASYDGGPRVASNQRTTVKNVSFEVHSEHRPAPPTSSDTTREVPELMSNVGASADDGGYHYYERIHQLRTSR